MNTQLTKIGLIVAGAALLWQYPPSIAVPNIFARLPYPTIQLEAEELQIGIGVGDESGATIYGNGRYVINYDTGSATNVGALNILSNRGGIKVVGHYYGIRAKNVASNGEYGRAAVVGQVRAPGDPDPVRGYMGYIEQTGPTIITAPLSSFGPVSMSASPPGPSMSIAPVSNANSAFPNLEPIANGTVWGFFTEGLSRFVDVEFGGAITSTDDTIEIGTTSSPEGVALQGDVYFPEDETDNIVTAGYFNFDRPDYDEDLGNSGTGEIFHSFDAGDFLILMENDDYDATVGGIDSMLFTSYAYYNSDHYTPPSGPTHSIIIDAEARCPVGSVRIACNGWITNHNTSAALSPYRGAYPVADEGCRAITRYAGQPTIHVQATCMAASLPLPDSSVVYP